MTPDEFRHLFAKADHLLPVHRTNGNEAIAVGLNGDKCVSHGGEEIPLAHLVENPLFALMGGSGLAELTAAELASLPQSTTLGDRDHG
jgi:hypothetical protein